MRKSGKSYKQNEFDLNEYELNDYELNSSDFFQETRRRRNRKAKLYYLLAIICILVIIFALKIFIPFLLNGLDKKSRSDIAPEQKNVDSSIIEDDSLKESGKTDVYYYYYELLNENEKAVYDSILNGYKDLKSDIDLEINLSDLNKMVLMVAADHPELFWVDSNYEYMTNTKDNTIILRPQYNCSEKEKEKRETEILSSTESILSELSTETDEYEKVKKVFEYLIDTIIYELDAPDNQNIYSSLVNKRSVCAGYAKATQYLLQKSGITTLYVTGEILNRGYHAWNIVKCNGDYYQVDTTFGDSNYTNLVRGEELELPSELSYNYAYLCCNDSVIYRDRAKDEILSVPSCTKGDNNYYVLNGSYYEQYSLEIDDAIADSVKKGNHSWQCQFSNKDAYTETLDKLKEGLYANIIFEQNKNSGNIQTYYSYDEVAFIVKVWY